jgi:hypothetical protein
LFRLQTYIPQEFAQGHLPRGFVQVTCQGVLLEAISRLFGLQI